MKLKAQKQRLRIPRKPRTPRLSALEVVCHLCPLKLFYDRDMSEDVTTAFRDRKSVV